MNELAFLLFVDVAVPLLDFVGISPMNVFKLKEQVFVDVLQQNFTYFADFTF